MIDPPPEKALNRPRRIYSPRRWPLLLDQFCNFRMLLVQSVIKGNTNYFCSVQIDISEFGWCRGRATKCFIGSLERFIRIALDDMAGEGSNNRSHPWHKCDNTKMLSSRHLQVFRSRFLSCGPLFLPCESASYTPISWLIIRQLRALVLSSLFK